MSTVRREAINDLLEVESLHFERPVFDEAQIRSDMDLLAPNMAPYSDTVDSVLSSIESARETATAHGTSLKSILKEVPGHEYTSPDLHCFRVTDSTGKDIFVKVMRSAAESDWRSQDRLGRVVVPLLEGRGNPQLEQLLAADSERGVLVSSTPPGKSMLNIGIRDILKIKPEHIQQLNLTLGDLRQKGLMPTVIDCVRFDEKTGFGFEHLSLGAFELFDLSHILNNPAVFIHWALTDHAKLNDYKFLKHEQRMPVRFENYQTTGLRAMLRGLKVRTAADVLLNAGPAPNYYDSAQPLPEYEPSPELITIDNLSERPAPAGASRYVRTSVHTVRRNNGDTGYQVVNDLKPGVSLLAIDVVLGHAYGIFVDQMRYPHARPGQDFLNLEMAARRRRIGRWSREIISGGVEFGETEYQALAREAAEEAGIMGIDPATVERLYPELRSSVSINKQPFNLFVAKVGEGMWSPELAFPDAEEGRMPVGAYRLDTAVPEMIRNGTIFEMSAVTAVSGLYRTRWRKYL